MKLENKHSIFNMGDTSIRVKQLVEVNRFILKHINEYMKDEIQWERNTALQEDFYKSFIEQIAKTEENDGIELFSDFKRAKNYSVTPNKLGLRGRTLTNALLKTGLITPDRMISRVGNAYFNNTLKKSDDLEKILELSADNLVYLRQFLKLRIYASDSDKYFYNFRFALLFLTKYDNVPQQDFLKIVESIRPEQSHDELQNIINEYQDTYDNKEVFESYYKRMFAQTLRSQSELDDVKEFFDSNDLSDDNFIKYFNNRDSSKTSLLYKKYVLCLLDFANTESKDMLVEITKLSKDEKIKKAFGEGKIPFKFTKNNSVEEFIQNNISNPLLSGNGFQIYLQFIFSKHNDLIKEYSDMCRRAFQVTGLISFDNGLVNLNSKWIITPLLELLGDKFKLTGDEPYNNYELNSDSAWFSDLTTTEILNITHSEIQSLYNALGKKFGITDLSQVNKIIIDKREKEYRDFIESHFPISTVLTILKLIKQRDDEQVFKLVTENANVPTIYEYILTIAWYHLSQNKNFMIHKTFQVSLDGNKLPLTHRGGGAGDIEIINDEYALLIEATLMDMNTQKRGELEPVIRHSINFELSNSGSQTIFIANELDNNVLNIFRASKFIQFNGTLNSGSVDGLSIFALTTDELIQILISGITDIELLEKIKDSNYSEPTQIVNNWRASIISNILERK